MAPLSNAIPDKYLTNLDPEWRDLWTRHGHDVVGAHLVSIEEFRQCPAKYSFTYPTWEGPDVYKVQDYSVPVDDPNGSINCRVYTPRGSGPFPMHLNFHGGGWVLGGLNTEAAWCRSICNEAGVVVIDVDYRLAPEFPFPTAIYDCWTALKWAITNAEMLLNTDPTSVSIGGLSSGGSIAAVLAHFARDSVPKVELKLQLLIVPATDMRYVPISIDKRAELTPESCPYSSAIFCADVPWSPLERESWFLKYYIGEDPKLRSEILTDWRMTPVLSPCLSNLAPAHIVTAEYDIERDEAEHYGRMLRDAGTPVSVKRYLGVPHAFAHYNHPSRGLSRSHEFIRDTAQLLLRVHSKTAESLRL